MSVPLVFGDGDAQDNKPSRKDDPATRRLKKGVEEFQLGRVLFDQFDNLEFIPGTSFFRTPGHIHIVLTNAKNGKKVILTGSDAEGTPDGDIVIRGDITIEEEEGTLTGRSLQYNAPTRTGFLLDAATNVRGLSVTGKRIELLPDRALKVTGGSFTNCDKPRPDYLIRARELRVSPDRVVTAKHVTFYLFGTRLLTLPSLKKSFNSTTDVPLPLPGYSSVNGVTLRFRNDLLRDAGTSADYNITLSSKRIPQGILAYEHEISSRADRTNDDSPPRTRQLSTTEPLRSALEYTPALLRSPGAVFDPEAVGPRRTLVYGLIANDTFVYNRTRSDLRISRLPEIGLSFRNLLNRREEPDKKNRIESVFGTQFFNTKQWLVNAELGLGYFLESPTGNEGSRLGSRLEASSPLFVIAKPLYVRYGGTLSANLYDNGKTYSLLSPEVELSYLLRSNTLLSAAYRYQTDFGDTSFEFDGLDVRHELRLRYGFLGAKWAYDLSVNYDMDRLRAYDTIVAIRRRFDCMEIGLSYRARNQSFNILFNLLPGSPARSKAR